MTYLAFFECLVLQVEVEQSHSIDVRQVEVPVLPLFRLFANGERGIVERTVLEILLIGVLHLDDEFLVVLTFAIDVKYRLALGIDVPDVLVVEIFHVLYDLSAVEQAVQEVYQQLLVGSRAEDALETEIGQQADVSVFYFSHGVGFFDCCAKVRTFSENPKSFPVFFQLLSRLHLLSAAVVRRLSGDVSRRNRTGGFGYALQRDTASLLLPVCGCLAAEGHLTSFTV